MTEPHGQENGGGGIPAWLALGWLCFLTWMVAYIVINLTRAAPS